MAKLKGFKIPSHTTMLLIAWFLNGRLIFPLLIRLAAAMHTLTKMVTVDCVAIVIEFEYSRMVEAAISCFSFMFTQVKLYTWLIQPEWIFESNSSLPPGIIP